MKLYWIPWAMVVGRALMGPVIVSAAERDWDGAWLGLMVLAALLSDIYDGILASRWGCDTPAVRLADSLADTVFYVGVGVALWIRNSHLLRENRVLLGCLFCLEVLRYGFDFWKYGKAASYHSYLAKCWGLTTAIAIIAVFSLNKLGWLVSVSLVLGIASDMEGLTMSLMLPRWRNDVKTLRVARRIRREMLSHQPPTRCASD